MQDGTAKHNDTRMPASKAASSNTADQIESNRKSGGINEGIRQMRGEGQALSGSLVSGEQPSSQSRLERQLTPGAADTCTSGVNAQDSRRNTDRIIATDAAPRRRASDPLLDIDNDDLAAVVPPRRGSGHNREDEEDKGIVGVDVD